MNNTYVKINYFTSKMVKYKNVTSHQINSQTSQQKKTSQGKFIDFCHLLKKVDGNLN